jgi:23S rRNA pseudouridine1911/1915/1917 synthase
MRLDEAVSRQLSAARGRRLSRSQSRKLIVVGAVSVDDRTLRQPGRTLAAGARVQVLLRGGLLARHELLRDRAFELTRSAIVYEDEALIAIDKPPGLPTQPTADPSRPSLIAALARHLGPAAYLGVHQRLDRDTSGIVLFAKDRRANPGLAQAFAERAVVKVYAALTAVGPAGHVDQWLSVSRLSRGEGNPPRVRVVRAGGLEARTSFRVSRRLSHAWLLEAIPATGRKHQIRVQLAAGGLPILGDTLYGGAASVAGRRVARTMLHATRLELPHPLSGALLRIASRLPADFEALLR